MSEHYLCLRVDALQCILPAGAKRKGSVSIAKKQIVELVDKTACQENDLTPSSVQWSQCSQHSQMSN